MKQVWSWLKDTCWRAVSRVIPGPGVGYVSVAVLSDWGWDSESESESESGWSVRLEKAEGKERVDIGEGRLEGMFILY